MSQFTDLDGRVRVALLLVTAGLISLLVIWPWPWAVFVGLFGLLFALELWSHWRIQETSPEARFSLLIYGIVGGLGFWVMAALRYQDGGRWIIVMIALTVIVTDIAAYFFGRKYGRHHPFPNTSPNKTREGTILGWLSGVSVMSIYWAVVGGIYGFISVPSAATVYLMVFLTPTVAIAGDLLASKTKRLLGVKDFSDRLGDHGGVADRFDALCAAFVLAGVVWVF